MSQPGQGELIRDIAGGVLITGSIFCLAVYLSVFGFICAMFIPLPMVYYRLKLGRKNAIHIPVLSLIIISWVLGKFGFDTIIFLELMLLGFFLGENLEKRLPIEKAALYTTAAVMGTSLACLMIYSTSVNSSPLMVVGQYVDKNLEWTLIIYEKLGVDQELIQAISNSLDRIRFVLMGIIPALLMSSTLFLVWIMVLSARPLCNKGGVFFPDLGRLNLWRPPEFFVWAVIGCAVMLMLPAKPIKIIGLNGMILLMTIYFFSGIAIVSYYFEKKEFPLFFKIIFYSLIAVQQLVLLFVIGLGFFDIWVNFRKRGSGSDR